MTAAELIDILSKKNPNTLILVESIEGPIPLEELVDGVYFSEGMDTDFVPNDELDEQVRTDGQPATILLWI